MIVGCARGDRRWSVPGDRRRGDARRRRTLRRCWSVEGWVRVLLMTAMMVKAVLPEIVVPDSWCDAPLLMVTMLVPDVLVAALAVLLVSSSPLLLFFLLCTDDGLVVSLLMRTVDH